MKDYIDIFLANKNFILVNNSKGIQMDALIFNFKRTGEEMSMDENKENDTQRLVSEDIEDFGQSLIKDEDATIYLISIIGEIEGHECLPSISKTKKYENVLPKLA